MASLGLRTQPLNTVNVVSTANRLPHVSGRNHPISRYRVTEERLPIYCAASYQVRLGCFEACSLPCTMSILCRWVDRDRRIHEAMQSPSSAPAATELDLLEEYTNVVPDTVSNATA